MTVIAEGLALPYRTHATFDAWRLLTEDVRADLPEDAVTSALLEAIEAEDAQPVKVSGRLAQEETERLLAIAAQTPARARDDWTQLVDLEVLRRRAVMTRAEEDWRELFREADRVSALPGELGALGTLYLAISLSAPRAVRWSEAEIGLVTERMNALPQDEQFASALEMLANRDDLLADEETLDRAARLFDRGWPLGPPMGIALHGANQALRLGDPDRAAEWVGRFDGSVAELCAVQHPDCVSGLVTLQQVLGQLTVLDDLEPPTLHAAVVHAVLACHEQHPLEDGQLSLRLPVAEATDPFARCLQERYRRLDCADVTVEIGAAR